MNGRELLELRARLTELQERIETLEGFCSPQWRAERAADRAAKTKPAKAEKPQ